MHRLRNKSVAVLSNKYIPSRSLGLLQPGHTSHRLGLVLCVLDELRQDPGRGPRLGCVGLVRRVVVDGPVGQGEELQPSDKLTGTRRTYAIVFAQFSIGHRTQSLLGKSCEDEVRLEDAALAGFVHETLA